jgi:hypothetical protein
MTPMNVSCPAILGCLSVQPMFACGGYEGLLAAFLAVPICFAGAALLIASLIHWFWNKRAAVACLLAGIASFLVAWTICQCAGVHLLGLLAS